MDRFRSLSEIAERTLVGVCADQSCAEPKLGPPQVRSKPYASVLVGIQFVRRSTASQRLAPLTTHSRDS